MDEVYSGDSPDPTNESIETKNGIEIDGWSIMRNDWDRGRNNILIRDPLSKDYFAFSIEELITVEFVDVTTVKE